MTKNRPPLLTQRALLLLFVALTVAVAGGLLLRLTGAPLAACVVASGAAFLTTLKALHELVA
jgi:hypothetical protein